MAALYRGKRIFSVRHNLFKTSKRQSGYYVLLPEIGDDLSNKNFLLREDTKLPEFNSFSIERCIAAIGRQTMEFEQGIDVLEKEIQESEKLNILKDVLEPIEKLEIPLQISWGISKVLYFGNQSMMPTQCYINIHKRTCKALSCKYNSEVIFKECKKTFEEKNNLTDEENRILFKYITEGRLNGLDVKKKEEDYFLYLIRQINDKTDEYRQKLEIATNLFQRKITNPLVMKDFPTEFLKSVAVDPNQYEVGPWIITLKPNCLQTFLEYCSDPLLRLNIWLASVLRCSLHGEQELENSSLVNSITSHRTLVGRYLGFKNYSEMSMCTKMAGSLENVYKFLQTLLEAGYPHQVDEMNELTQFARERGFVGNLKQWDIPYWARKHKRALFNYDEEILKKYFSLPKVMEGLFSLLKELFNVNIVERQKVDVWHRDVCFFDVYDFDISATEPVGSFYFDPYARDEQKLSPNKYTGWVLLLKNKSDINENKPLVSVIFNFEPPQKDGLPSLLTFRSVQSLFENFGQVMQQLLTRVKSSEVAGLANVEWDAVDTSRQLMTHFLYEPDVLNSIGSHYETGESLSNEMIENLRRSRVYMSGYNLCKELYLSRFDLDLHSIERSWESIMKKAWKDHFVIPEDKKDSHVCSWDDIFVKNLGASYYSELWSKMLAADIYSAFKESQSKNTNYRSVIGKRYKETFLNLGGSVSASEIFRRFRGRDPCSKVLIQNLNLDSNPKSNQEL